MAIIKGNFKQNNLLGTTGNDSIYGYGDNDTLTGSAGNDLLVGGRGKDVMKGGSGNDTYQLDDAVSVSDFDVLVEAKGAGIDTIISPRNFSLPDNFENLVLTGTKASYGSGNSLANKITGNALNNELLGNAGNDSLVGATGVDSLKGGEGNDLLSVADFNGDYIDGGTGNDKLQILGENQTVNLIKNAIKNIESIKFADDSNGTLILNAASVLALSSESDTLVIEANGENTLSMETGWTDGGIVNGYQVFTKDGATLQINEAIGNIEQADSKYTISNILTAIGVSQAFTPAVDVITIDFGGQSYLQSGVIGINLTGFGLEDKLVIAQHDGAINNGGAHFHTSDRNIYIHDTGPGVFTSDRVVWGPGEVIATLRSSKYFTSSTWSGGQTTYFGPIGSIRLTGLPAGLADSQFVFI